MVGGFVSVVCPLVACFFVPYDAPVTGTPTVVAGFGCFSEDCISRIYKNPPVIDWRYSVLV